MSCIRNLIWGRDWEVLKPRIKRFFVLLAGWPSSKESPHSFLVKNNNWDGRERWRSLKKMSGLNASSPSHGAVNKKALWNSEMGESNIRRHHTHEQKSIENYEFSALTSSLVPSGQVSQINLCVHENRENKFARAFLALTVHAWCTSSVALF